ncbi:MULTISPECIES: hypothetical protein [Xanthomonas]|uniref:hypothetical protein n=1 Tax=Xanthomonas TaxID=338 RepID=UPI000AFD351A|nr:MULTISPECIES: hypothetical protein [Xanthomonas]
MKNKSMTRSDKPLLVQKWLLLCVAFPAAWVAPASAVQPATHLFTATSLADETLDAFVTRMAPRARAASVSSRAVACGEIQGNGPYTVVLKTDGYQGDCRVRRAATPYVLVNGIAKDARADRFSIENRFRPGYLITPWNIKYQDRDGVRKVGAVDR